MFQVGEQLEHRADTPLDVIAVAAVDVGTHHQVLADRHVREHAVAARELLYAETGPQLWRGVGDGPATEAHHPPLWDPESADHPQDGGLAGTVGAEQGQRFALPHLERHVEQHLDRPVREVDVVELQGRDLAVTGGSSLLVLFVEELLDVEGQVLADVSGAPVHDPPAYHR